MRLILLALLLTAAAPAAASGFHLGCGVELLFAVVFSAPLWVAGAIIGYALTLLLRLGKLWRVGLPLALVALIIASAAYTTGACT